MAIDSEINKILVDRIYAIYSHAETEILKKVANRVERNVTESGWVEAKANDIVKFKQEIEELINDVEKLAKTEVPASIVDAYLKGVNSAEEDYSIYPYKAEKTILATLSIPTSIQNLVLESEKLIINTSARILRSTMDAYREIQAEAATGVLTGIETRKQASQRMLNMLSDRGITSFVDVSGRKWDMASYAEMSMRTVTGRAALQGHLDRQLDFDNDLVVISAHRGSCPICAPWAGKILSITGKTPGYTTIQQARDAGLFHPNCRHTATGYIEGMDLGETKDYDPVPYKYEQKQRANERAIRKWKKREVVAIEPLEKKKAQNKIRLYQANQRALLNQYEELYGTKLKRKYDRESIKARVR